MTNNSGFTDADLARIQLEREKRKLDLYRPYLRQQQFHKAAGLYRETLLRAGNQQGKTLCAAANTAIHATGKYPAWWEGKVLKKAPVIWVAGVTGEVVRDSIQKLLIGDSANPGTGFIPADDIIEMTPSRGVADLIDTIYVKHVSGGKTRIRLKYYEQGREKFQADTVDLCIAKNELVQMADGRLTPIQDVKVGDFVFTIDNKGKRVSRRVAAVHEKGMKPIVEARLSRGMWLRLTEDHEVFDGVRNKKEVKDANKIYQLPANWQPENTIDKIDAFYAWAGLVISEGYIKGRKITMGDCKAVETAVSILPPEARVRKKVFANTHVPDWFLYWSEFWELFPDALSHEKNIPDFILTSSNEKVALFLSYLFAGDGWANGHTIGYASTSRLLASQLTCLLSRLGIRSTVIKKPPQDEKWREQWWVMITSADHILDFIEKIGIIGKEAALEKVKTEAIRRIESKSNRCSHLKKSDEDRKHPKEWLEKRCKAFGNRYSQIREILPAGEDMVYDISVETNHSFSLGTSIVSNCWLDEEPALDIYTEALTRTNATKGFLYMTFTPLKGMSEVVRKFLHEKSPDRCDINMTIEDALHIEPAERQKIIDSYPAHERTARIMGQPILGSGRIFPIAEEDIACDPFDMASVPFFWQEIAGIDFGWDHPTAAVKLLYNPQDDIIYVTNSYKRSEQTPLIHAAALKPWGKNIPWAWPHDGLIHDKNSGDQLSVTYRELGMNMMSEHATFENGSNSVEAGLTDMLMRMQTGRLKVFRHLNEWFEEFRLYHRKEGKIVKEYDDLLAATRYACVMLRNAARVRKVSGMRSGYPIEEDNNSRSTHLSNYNPLSREICRNITR